MTIEEARQALASCPRIVALTGAGMSAESGVPTFRGPEGLWRNFRPEDLATPEAFERRPDLVWEWYEWRRQTLSRCVPNAGHRILAERGIPIVTQNVDGMHQRAGSKLVIELHGNIWKTLCSVCGENLGPQTCPRCGGRARPGVVWFGESLPPLVWEAGCELVSQADALLVIGTSGTVYPAAQLAPLARQAGALVLEINLEHATLLGPCGEILPKLLQ